MGARGRSGNGGAMYEGDSFFTLGPAGRAGLLAVSAALAAATLLALRRLGRGRRPAARALWALGLFWGFVWLSPQVYYLYYQAIIPGLPWQAVIRAPPGPRAIGELLVFAARPTLSDHGKGALGWALLGLALGPWFRRRRSRR